MEMLNEMAVFSQVVDSGSFSAAGRQLGLTASSTSRHINRLETHLGGRLLLRNTRSLSLTELGQQVYDACARMLGNAREVHALAGSYRTGPTGTLRLSAPVGFGQSWLVPRLPGFFAAYPEVDLDLTLIDRPIDLVNDGVDLAIRIADAVAPGLAVRTMLTFDYVLVAAPDYLRRRGAPAIPEELAEHACLGRYGNVWTLINGERRVVVNTTGRLAVNNSAAIVAMAASGVAIGLVPQFAAHEALEDGRLVRILPDWAIGEPYTGTAHFVYTPGRHVALKIRAFIDHFVAAARS